MTREEPTKKVDASYATQRLAIARAYHDEAHRSRSGIAAGSIANPAVSATVLSAIAFTDALTAKYAGEINQQDHSAAVKVLRAALADNLPNQKEAILKRILDQKDRAEYGPRVILVADATRLLALLDDYAAWAETLLT